MPSETKPNVITDTKPLVPAPETPLPGHPKPNTLELTKPASGTEVKPALPERAPKTSYDVDVYDPKLGDTYESISQEWFNGKQYAAALKAYNQNQPLQGGRYVNIPPVYILERMAPTTGGNVTRPRTGSAPTADGPNWTATPSERPTPTTGRSTFLVPR
ncbi:MAG TPA: hypothetical protein VGE74_29425, partial [Gemmata sp.]